MLVKALDAVRMSSIRTRRLAVAVAVHVHVAVSDDMQSFFDASHFSKALLFLSDTS